MNGIGGHVAAEQCFEMLRRRHPERESSGVKLLNYRSVGLETYLSRGQTASGYDRSYRPGWDLIHGLRSRLVCGYRPRKIH